MAGPLGNTLRFNDRMIVYGFAREEKTLTNHAWLFVHRAGEPPIPLAEYAPVVDIARHLGEFHVRQLTQGGLCRLENGGWVAVDPLDYTVRIFDASDRQVGAFNGINSAFRKPDITAYPHNNWGPGDRSSYFAWLEAQCQVKRPVSLGADLIGVVVGIPDPRGGQHVVLDVYRLDGTAIANAAPIPGIRAPRIVVADADAGRLVLLSQDRNWPFGAPATLWEVTVANLPLE